MPLEWKPYPRPLYLYDRVKQALRLETERPIALRQAIMAVRNGGTVSVPGVYGGLMDKMPMGFVMNRSITIKTDPTHIHRYMRPLLERIEKARSMPPSSLRIVCNWKMRRRPTAPSGTNRTNASKWYCAQSIRRDLQRRVNR